MISKRDLATLAEQCTLQKTQVSFQPATCTIHRLPAVKSALPLHISGCKSHQRLAWERMTQATMWQSVSSTGKRKP